MIKLQNVYKTGSGKNSCNSSRREILAWVNETLDTTFMELDDLRSGVEYCQLLHKLRPTAINLRKVIVNTLAQHEHILNMKLLQKSLWNQGVEKQIPILRLVSGACRESLEFGQWFKAFYQRNYVQLKEETETKDPSICDTYSIVSLECLQELRSCFRSSGKHTRKFRSCECKRHSNAVKKNSEERGKYSKRKTKIPYHRKDHRKESAFSRFRRTELFGFMKSTVKVNYSRLKNLNYFGIAHSVYRLLGDADKNKVGKKHIYSKLGEIKIKLNSEDQKVFSRAFDKKCMIMKSIFVCDCYIKRKWRARTRPRINIEGCNIPEFCNSKPIDLTDQQQCPLLFLPLNSETKPTLLIKDSGIDLVSQESSVDDDVSVSIPLENLLDEKNLQKETQLAREVPEEDKAIELSDIDSAFEEVQKWHEHLPEIVARKILTTSCDTEEIDFFFEPIDIPSLTYDDSSSNFVTSPKIENTNLATFPDTEDIELFLGPIDIPPPTCNECSLNRKTSPETDNNLTNSLDTENIELFWNPIDTLPSTDDDSSSNWLSVCINYPPLRIGEDECVFSVQFNRQKKDKNVRLQEEQAKPKFNMVTKPKKIKKLRTRNKRRNRESKIQSIQKLLESNRKCLPSQSENKKDGEEANPDIEKDILFDTQLLERREPLTIMKPGNPDHISPKNVSTRESHIASIPQRISKNRNMMKTKKPARYLCLKKNSSYPQSQVNAKDLKYLDETITGYERLQEEIYFFKSRLLDLNFRYQKATNLHQGNVENVLQKRDFFTISNFSGKLWGEKFSKKRLRKCHFRACNGSIQKLKNFKSKIKPLEYWIRQGKIPTLPISTNKKEINVDKEIAMIIDSVGIKLEVLRTIQKNYSKRSQKEV
ncbi:uncharacterized protein [Drosophila takahashii]|uniref:uncharacterized protein n=1 Tax=Drosophila takahashii TaxID=29030 RepID=UPI003899150D